MTIRSKVATSLFPALMNGSKADDTFDQNVSMSEVNFMNASTSSVIIPNPTEAPVPTNNELNQPDRMELILKYADGLTIEQLATLVEAFQQKMQKISPTNEENPQSAL